MGAESPVIRNISDTARWVAIYRAMETERPDAHFHDPYARMLAGEKGEEIFRRMPRARLSAWPLVVRTCVFDELILRAVEREGADTVLNLASGLDTRPYRLPLPAELRWIEADLPEILAYKDEKLASETPRCLRESVMMDLGDVPARRGLFERVAASSKKTVIVTEGFLAYLTEGEVASLAVDLCRPSFRWWILDLASPLLMKRMQKIFGKTLAQGDARMQFAPAEGTEFFRKLGWAEVEFRSVWEEAHRLRREMPFAWLWRLVVRLSPASRREAFRRMGATVLLERVPGREPASGP